MKKLVLLLAVVASATLFSCSGNQAATTDTTAAEAEQTEAPAADTTAAPAADTTAAQA